MKTILNTIFCVCFVATLFGCKGADGPAGPAGNANVQTVTFSLSSSSWQQSSNAFIATKSIPQITSDIASNDAVLAFVQDTQSSLWLALPYTWSYNLGGTRGTWAFSHMHDVGAIGFMIIDSDSNNPLLPALAVARYKVIAIAGSSSYMLAGVNTQDYQQVKKALNLED